MLTHPRQELFRLGILYNNDEDIAQDSKSNTVACDIPVEQSVPMFVIRHGKPCRSRRRSTWRSLPLYLSLSTLTEDADIARLLSPSTPHTPTIQHRDTSIPTPTTTDIPLSLPAPPALESTHKSEHLLDNTVQSPHSFDLNSGDWTFITTPHTTPLVSTPSASEPETWILLSDDS
jgi:hypothetical protein